MTITAKDVIPLSQARSRLSEIADEVKTGLEKIITKNGESYVALIDSDRLDYYHRLERERIHLLLLEEAEKGLADIAVGKVKDARQVIRRLTTQAQESSGEVCVALLHIFWRESAPTVRTKGWFDRTLAGCEIS